MRKICANPLEDTDRTELDKLVRYAVSKGTNTYIGHKRYAPMVYRGIEMLPPGWSVVWVSRALSVGRLGAESGITAQGYQLIIIPNADSVDSARSFLHELYHARGVGEHKLDKLKKYDVWAELEAELYALTVMYKSKDSPYFNSIDGLLKDHLGISIGYGVWHIANYIDKGGSIKKGDIPSRWRFMLPYVEEALGLGPDKFYYECAKLKKLPAAITDRYKEMITQ